MIEDVIQEEKNKISEILVDISNTINKLQFLNMSDYQVSEDLKKRWELKLKKFFADIDNYQKNEFPIVVLGRWNSGKSTLINAILGEEILPSANKEMTSILTKIYYGEGTEVIIQFDEGKNKTIQRTEMKDYINFRGNKYSEKLKQIDVRSNNSFLKSGLCILDTPGLSSINELNNNIAFDIMPKANSVLLTFSGLDVGGDDNLNLIEQVLRLNYDNLYNIIFVITKSDLLSEEEALDAKESLKELIDIVQKRLGVFLEGRIQICTVSSYMELRYRQYLNHDISEQQLLDDRKLDLSNINKVRLLHEESNFDEFYKVLDESILSSENRKNITYKLFIMIQNVLTELLENYNNIYKYLSKSNNSSLEQISGLLQHRVDIETKIWEEGRTEITNYYETIKGLNNFIAMYKRINNVINRIYIALCRYIDNTPYEVISKDKFADLNEKINIISTNIVTDWMREIAEQLDNELEKTINKIAEIIEKNSKEIDEVFMKENKDIDLKVYGIKLKTNASLSNFIISVASSASVGAGLFAIGNGILPGIGGIVGSIVGGLLGFVASMLKLSTSEKRKEVLKTKLNKYLSDTRYKYRPVLEELYLRYENTGKLLEQYLNTSLKQVIQDKDSIIENYNATKVKYAEIERKLTQDIKSIKELIPEINLAFSQYIKLRL